MNAAQQQRPRKPAGPPPTAAKANTDRSDDVVETSLIVDDNDELLVSDDELLEAEVFAEAVDDMELVLELAELDDLEIDMEIAELEMLTGSGGSSSSGSFGSFGGNSYGSRDTGLTPYFDPFFSMFGAFSSQLPSLIVLEMSPNSDDRSSASGASSSSSSSSSRGGSGGGGGASADAASSTDLAALEHRIEQLEQSNLLLASDFTTNAEAFWDACTVDVLGFCDVDALQQLPCLPSQTAMATECLEAHFGAVRVPDCKVGVKRMTTWYQVHEADAAAAAAAGGISSDSDAYDDYVGTMNSFLNVFIGMLVFLFILRCCVGCAIMRKRRAAAIRALSARRASLAAQQKPASGSSASAPSSPCQERGEVCVVRGVAVTPSAATANDAEKQCAKVEGVYYL